MELKNGRLIQQVTKTEIVGEDVKELVARRDALQKKYDQIKIMIDELKVKIKAAKDLGFKE